MSVMTVEAAWSIAAATCAASVDFDRDPKIENLVRHNLPAAKRDDPRGDVDMDFFRLGVELEGADVEIDLVIRIRRRAVDPTRKPGVLKTLRQPRAEKRRQRLRP